MSMREDVIKFCQSIGRDRLLVQGAGGNVSWKDGDVLWVKASGTWLAHAGEQEIFVPVDLSSLQYAVRARDLSVTPNSLGASRLRPSIETMLHALMPHQVVVHLHPVDILAYLVCADSETRIRKQLKHNYKYSYIKYYKPGPELAEAVSRALDETPNADVLLLENHGIVLGGQNISALNELLRDLLQHFTGGVRRQTDSMPATFNMMFSDNENYLAISDQEINQLVYDNHFFSRLDQAWALYPDHVVFLGPHAVHYENFSQWRKASQPLQQYADVVFVKNCGIFIRRECSLAKQLQLRCYVDVITRLEHTDEVRTLSAEQIAALMGWEAERYRQKIAQ